MKLFRVDASPKHARSNSRALADHFVAELRRRNVPLVIDALDVAATPPPHPTELYARAIYAPAAERTEEMKKELTISDALCARMLAADALLFAMPMHNWTVPSAFKAFIDSIIRYGVTFTYDAHGNVIGLLYNKPTLFLTTRGGDASPTGPYGHMDALTPVLRSAFGFIGISTPTFVDAQPLQFAAPIAREEALVRAKKELEVVAEAWAK